MFSLNIFCGLFFEFVVFLHFIANTPDYLSQKRPQKRPQKTTLCRNVQIFCTFTRHTKITTSLVCLLFNRFGTYYHNNVYIIF